MKKIRLSKVLSERGIASRREADQLIEAGLVEVEGKVAQLGEKVDPDAKISLTKPLQKKATILLNKPVGYVSNLPEKGYRAAIELITQENQVGPGKFSVSMKKGLAVAGRLDIDSKGLLVMTQDGVIAKQLIGEKSEVEKEYRVYVEGEITEAKIRKLRFGLSIDGKALKRAKVDEIGPGLLRFVLKEGKKRQIRRMCEAVELKVTGLKRSRIGNVMLAKLPEGKWRFLSPDESFR
ncbi:MAG: rRNA pseudouridine synthase [Chlamydiia bacterium]|nr:rRNA pseudouridine synthase [Chlamydiia bacterium]